MYRVHLRKLSLRDLFLFYQYRRDTEVSRWTAEPIKKTSFGIITKVLHRAYQIVQFILTYSLNLKKPITNRYAIVRNDDNMFLGAVGITIQKDNFASADIGYWLGRHFWGKGLMTEALALAIELAFNNLHITDLTAWTYDVNIGSNKVLEINGFKMVNRLPNHYLIDGTFHDRLNYNLNKSEWHPMQRQN